MTAFKHISLIFYYSLKFLVWSFLLCLVIIIMSPTCGNAFKSVSKYLWSPQKVTIYICKTHCELILLNTLYVPSQLQAEGMRPVNLWRKILTSCNFGCEAFKIWKKSTFQYQIWIQSNMEILTEQSGSSLFTVDIAQGIGVLVGFSVLYNLCKLFLQILDK